MFIFGGRNERGDYLGDLLALDIFSRRWYAFQDSGRAPSPRSGLYMSSHGSKIYFVGGETRKQDEGELNLIFTLDTYKLKIDTA